MAHQQQPDQEPNININDISNIHNDSINQQEEEIERRSSTENDPAPLSPPVRHESIIQYDDDDELTMAKKRLTMSLFNDPIWQQIQSGGSPTGYAHVSVYYTIIRIT
jgi:hypothetical protein